MKLEEFKREDGVQSLLFECPGCDMLHVVHVAGAGHPLWQWNGSMDKPTFSPSVLVTYPWGKDREQRVCHSFVREGQIQFLGDCTHALAGQTVDLPDVD